jgi:hypothetical protein
MPEESSNSSGLPGRSRPALSELSKETTEADLWNLDDDLTERPLPQPAHPPLPRTNLRTEEPPESRPEPPSPAPPEPPAAEEPALPPGPQAPKPRGRTPAQRRPDHDHPLGNPANRTTRVDEIGELDELVESAPQPAPQVAAAPPPAAKPRAPEAPAKVLVEEPAPSPKSTRVEASSKAPTRPLRPRIDRREAVSLAAFAFVLLLVGIWVLSRFFSQFEFRSEFAEMPDFPVKGQHASLAAADTFWREPIRDSATRDFARREVKMIPVLDLSLDPAASPAGALLVIFRNGEGEPVGDSIRRSFSSGNFDASGTPAMSFPATDGFLEEGAYQGYRTGKGRPWLAEVLEGPSVDAPAESFKPLATIPVSPLRR